MKAPSASAATPNKQVKAKSKGWSCDTAMAPNTHRAAYSPNAPAAPINCPAKVCSFSRADSGTVWGGNTNEEDASCG